MSCPDLWAELSAALKAVTPAHTRRLVDLGVRPGNLQLCGVATIRTEADGFYTPDPGGASAVVVPVVDDHEIVDTIAWQTSRPDRWWTRRHACSLLGGDALNDLWLGQRLRIHKTPLSWLAGTDPAGVVVLQWGPAVAHLVNVPVLEVEDKAHAAEVRGKLRSTVVLPKIAIASTSAEAA